MAESPTSPKARSHDALIDAVLLGLLVIVTLVSFTASEEHESARGWWIALILGLAFAKAIAIGCRYMSLGKAPRPLLLAFLGWAAIFFALTTTLAIL